MTRLVLVFVFVASVGLQAQDWPSQHVAIALYPEAQAASVAAEPTQEWLVDLRAIAKASAPKADLDGVLRNAEGVEFMPMSRIKALASVFKTKADLEKALVALPTKERQDRARKTLEPFTAWGLPIWDGSDPHKAHTAVNP